MTNGRKGELPWLEAAPEQGWLEGRRAASEGASPVGALVDVALAVGSLEARRALAGVAVDVVGAGAPVPAGLAQTLVGVCLTFIPVKPGQADAREGVDPIHARGSVLAGI